MEAQKIIKRVLAGLGIVFIAGYSVFALGGFIRGPIIEITTPEGVRADSSSENLHYFSYATTTPFILVSGRAIHSNILLLNDLEIPQNLEGNFSESLLLAPGYNIISIEAKDRYGRTMKKTIEITLLVPKVATSTDTVASTTIPINF